MSFYLFPIKLFGLFQVKSQKNPNQLQTYLRDKSIEQMYNVIFFTYK